MDLYQRLDDALDRSPRSRGCSKLAGDRLNLLEQKDMQRVGVARSTLYQMVASELRRAIYSGELRPGDALPTEVDLMRKSNVSRNTVRLTSGFTFSTSA